MLQAGGTYQLIKEIPVGGDGGWDYMTVDSASQRLYVSHSTELVVIDLAHDTVAGRVTNTPGVHGLAPAPALGRGFISIGLEDKASIVDLKTLNTICKVETGQAPDCMLYEPGRQEAYMFNAHSDSATVIDGKSGKVVATIALGGKPEFAVADPAAGRVFDNLQDKNQVAVIDTKTHAVIEHWPIAPGQRPSGLAIDTGHHRLFIGCVGNRMMAMMDSRDGKVLATVPVGNFVDATAFDPGTQLAFASCYDGTTTIAHEDTPEKLTVVQVLPTGPHAKTMALDPKTHNIYFGTAKLQAPPGDKSGRRDSIPVPGTFKILVYGLSEK